MLGWYLSEIRREDILKKDNFKPCEVKKLVDKTKEKLTKGLYYGGAQQQVINPFARMRQGGNNPWAGRR